MKSMYALPFYVIWAILSGYIIIRGRQAIQQRQIIYRWWTPLGQMIVTLRGGGVIVIGLAQMTVGALLGMALLANLLQLNQQGALFSQLFLISIPLYGLFVWLMKRWLDVNTRHVWR
jgi:uncharacterized membrane protein